jgi:acyl-CoA synthetase (AMP-forming)/AMP-acid ligase II
VRDTFQPGQLAEQCPVVLQVAFGWENEYLHRFVIRGRDYGVPYVGGLSFYRRPRCQAGSSGRAARRAVNLRVDARRALHIFARRADDLVQRDSLDRDSMLTYLADKVAKWWLPDDVVFVEQLPHTSTGKLLKTQLRQEYRDHLLRIANHG